MGTQSGVLDVLAPETVTAVDVEFALRVKVESAMGRRDVANVPVLRSEALPLTATGARPEMSAAAGCACNTLPSVLIDVKN